MKIQVKRSKDGKIFTMDAYTDAIMSIHIFSYCIAVDVMWPDPNNSQPIIQTLICQKQDIPLDDYELQDNEEFGEIL